MARIGWTTCGVCANPEASVSENAAGTLSVACHKCQFSGYAKSGSRAARKIREKLEPDEDEKSSAPTQKSKPEPEPSPPEKTQSKRKVSTVFELGNI